MIIKAIVIGVFILILVSLGSALFHLVGDKNPDHSEKTVKALTTRITLSLLLFIFVFILIASGLLEPHGIGTRIHGQKKPVGSESEVSKPPQ